MSTGHCAFFATARTVLPTMERIRAALGSLAALLAPMTMRSGRSVRARRRISVEGTPTLISMRKGCVQASIW